MDKVQIEHKQIHDYSMRLRTIMDMGKSMGLSEEETALLMFAVMGDLEDEEKLRVPDVLKKIKLPRVKAKYKTEKLKRWIELLNRQLKAYAEDYGILDLETKEVLRMSRNGEYITVFGVKVLPYTLHRLIDLLDRNPDYAISVLLGIYEALGKILKFLGVEKVEE